MSPLEDRSTASWDDPLPYAIAAPRRRREQELPSDKLEDDKLEDDEAREGDIARVRDAIAETPGSPLRTARSIHNILVVDDDEQTLKAWKRAARDYTIRTATDAITARQLANAEHPDLAIVDLRLGSASGIDLIRDLKQDLPNPKLVLCSGYLTTDIIMAAVRAGADDVVSKPITFREILWRLEEGAKEPDIEDTPTLAHAEWEHIHRVLADCNYNISKAARRLGIYRSSLQRRLKKDAPYR
jgi:two-component system response regulator RegA